MTAYTQQMKFYLNLRNHFVGKVHNVFWGFNDCLPVGNVKHV